MKEKWTILKRWFKNEIWQKENIVYFKIKLRKSKNNIIKIEKEEIVGDDIS